MKGKSVHTVKSIYKKVVPLKLRNIVWKKLNQGERKSWREIETAIVLAFIKVLYFLSFRRFKHYFKEPKVLLCWPHWPKRNHAVLKRISYLLDYKITQDLDQGFHRMMEWEDVTERIRNHKYLKAIEQFDAINGRCLNISKERTDRIFEEVFGYPFIIDPLVHRGIALRKSVINAMHDGTIISCPIEKKEEGFVYQKIINNKFNGKYFYEIRVPIFRNVIPFVYYKYRVESARFESYVKADVVKQIDKVFTTDEIKKIFLFNEKVGLQYGELDVLRDKEDGRIYIVDVNNTPSGPRHRRMVFTDYIFAVVKLAETFDKVFMKSQSEPAMIPEEIKPVFESYSI